MTDRQIDEMLERAARARRPADPQLLARITTSIGTSLSPVRPIPGSRTLTLGLILASCGVALAGALRAGFLGLARLTLLESVLIFLTLAVLIGLAARECVNQWIPGSRHRLTPGAVLGLATVLLAAVFGALFHDYRVEHFFSAGLLCLATAVAHAAPVGILSLWLLRRGCALAPVNAGLVAGTLGGLSGIALLELHCANLQAAHVIFWHTAVLPVSAALGALSGWVLLRRRQGLEPGRGRIPAP